MQMQRIGVIGATGLMGHGIARNIQKAGYDLSYTVRRTEERVADLKEAGATRAADAAELGRTCDAVIICVTAAEDVEQVVSGERGLLTDPKEGLVIVDCSTSEPTMTLHLAELAGAAGVTFLDAPLTRGPAQAEEGTLNVILGGEPDDVARIRPVIEAFSGRIIETGPVGTAHALKLLNNFTIQASTTALAEAFAVAAKSGLDPRQLVEILDAGVYSSELLRVMGGTLGGDYTGMEFELDNARKDVRYYTRLAGERGVPAVVGDGVHAALRIASSLGFGSEYVPALVKAQAKLNGVEIGHDETA
jgi:3-hydroxyisobutyrate dehydrogenase-like beta-hydroxyacid dehydrogenase